jgi:tRNA A-37 threonylcarbamoyl transferase component Bud32
MYTANWTVMVEREKKIVYRDGARTIKLFTTHVPASAVLSEALNQARVHEGGLPAPRLLEVRKFEDNRWGILSEFADGDTMLLALEQESDTAALMDDFVRLQLRLHAHTAPLLTRQREKLHGKLSASGLDATTRYELHVRLDAMPRHNKVCHGDFVPSNVVKTKDGPIVLDWSHVTQGSATADAAATYLRFLKENKTDLAQLYLRLYCEKSDTARQHFERWLPIVAGAALANAKEAERPFYTSFCDGVAENLK